MKNALSRILLVGLKRLGNYRLWRIFHALLSRDRKQVEGSLAYVLNAEMPDRPFNRSFLQKYFSDLLEIRGATLALDVVDDQAQLLDIIPSETSKNERRMLWHYFSSIWDGEGDVIEIGPFLGGTSRAIALGMLAHPRYLQGRLLTYDRFQHYYSSEELKNFLTPLVQKGVLSEASLAKIGQEASFMNVFKEIHSTYSYGNKVIPIDRPLPETAQEADGAGTWFKLDDTLHCSAYFVDGCKSWYGTKYFMMECSRVAKPGACFIFQDYLMFTCFWLPAFVACFPEYLRLVCHVDHTYAFQLVKPLTRDIIDAAFPNEAETFSPDKFKTLFDAVRSYADRRGDREAMLKHALQYGAALAYIGQSDAARKIFAEIAKSPVAAGFEHVVKKASRTPTYRPNQAGGEPVLL